MPADREELPVVAKRLNEIVGTLGSRVALVHAAGVTPSRVYQWLRGDVKTLSAEAALHIEESTGYSARWLVLGKGPKRIDVNQLAQPQAAYGVEQMQGTVSDDAKLLFVLRTFLETDAKGRDAIWAGAKVAQRRLRAGRAQRRTGSADTG